MHASFLRENLLSLGSAIVRLGRKGEVSELGIPSGFTVSVCTDLPARE